MRVSLVAVIGLYSLASLAGAPGAPRPIASVGGRPLEKPAERPDWSNAQIVFTGKLEQVIAGPVGRSFPPMYTHRLLLVVQKVLRGELRPGQEITCSHSARQHQPPLCGTSPVGRSIGPLPGAQGRNHPSDHPGDQKNHRNHRAAGRPMAPLIVHGAGGRGIGAYSQRYRPVPTHRYVRHCQLLMSNRSSSQVLQGQSAIRSSRED